jgi:hypothetical protein
MKLRNSGKILAVAVILLFIGAVIQPTLAVIPDTSDSGNDCYICAKKLSKTHLVLIQSLLVRLENYDNELSVLIKSNPKIGEIHEELFNTLINVKEFVIKNIIYWDFPIICPLLFILQNLLIAIEFYSWYFGFHFDLPLVNAMIEILDVFGLALHCSWYVHPP